MPELALFVFYVGLALCGWRKRQADRRHIVLCVTTIALWSGTLLFIPATRLPMLGVAAITFLSLASPFQRLRGFLRWVRGAVRGLRSAPRVADAPLAQRGHT